MTTTTTTTTGADRSSYKPTPRSWLGTVLPEYLPAVRTLERLLLQDPQVVLAGSLEAGRVLLALGDAFLTPEQRRVLSAADHPGQDTEVRGIIYALGMCPWLLPDVPRSAEALTADLEKQRQFFGLQLTAAQLKSQGMDTLLALAAFGNWMVRQVLGWLREKLSDPALSDGDRQQLHDDFKPLLLLLKEEEGVTADERARQQATEDQLLAEVEAADAQVRELEAKMAARRGQAPDAQALRDLETAPQKKKPARKPRAKPPTPTRRTRR